MKQRRLQKVGRLGNLSQIMLLGVFWLVFALDRLFIPRLRTRQLSNSHGVNQRELMYCIHYASPQSSQRP